MEQIAVITEAELAGTTTLKVSYYKCSKCKEERLIKFLRPIDYCPMCGVRLKWELLDG